MKEKTKKQIIYGIITGLIIVIILQHFIYGKNDKDYNIQTQLDNTMNNINEDSLCPKEIGKLCDKNQRVVVEYTNICEKKKLFSDTSHTYVSDLSPCLIDGNYCYQSSGYVCHTTFQQRLYYSDTCKKSDLEKRGYIEC